ncbi:MAG: hypothetical protein KKA07_04150 [Bacteroidetes bacterium]|nr:hypothetical protein [Bacteroidota bacterium]MBU1718243.1 hypothetical protein [Bacteroidota bacterium]
MTVSLDSVKVQPEDYMGMIADETWVLDPLTFNISKTINACAAMYYVFALDGEGNKVIRPNPRKCPIIRYNP